MSVQETVTAQITKLSPETKPDHPAWKRVGVEYGVSKELPQNINEAVEMYGEDVVFSRFKAALVIDLQSFMRSQIKSEDFTEDGLQQAVDEWAPGTRRVGVSLEQKAENLMARMTDEQLEALLERVREKKSAA